MSVTLCIVFIVEYGGYCIRIQYKLLHQTRNMYGVYEVGSGKKNVSHN